MKIVNKNKAISESFANNLDKDILDIIKANKEQINYVKQGKCSKSSGYNILKAYNDPNTKEIKLVVGHLKPSNGKEELPTNTITHMWVEVDGNIYATNEPKGFDRVVDDSLVIDKSKDLYSQVEAFLTKPTLKENLIESNNYGYHAGDLGKSEYYGQQSSGRGTGHFGTGTYFVGDPNRIKGYNDYQYGKGEAPHHIVDFSSYNLYKPSTNKKGYALHDTLKVLDGNYTYWKDKVDDVNVVRKYSTKSKRNYDQFTEDELEELINALNRLDNDEEPLNFEYFSTFLIPSNFDNYYEELTLADVDTDDAWDTQFELMEQLYDKVQEWSSSNVLYAVDKVRNIESHLYQALEGKVSMSKIKQGLDAVEKASKQYKANRDRKVDSLATVFMKSLGYDGVDTRHLNKDDNEEGLAGLDNTAYGSVIYDVRPETIVESYEGKTFKLPQELVDKCIDYYKETYPTIKVDKLPIEQLVKDNNLLDDEDLQSYHQKQWDNKSAKEFSIAQDKINSMRVSEVPFVVKKKDKLELVDGRHRVRALYNDGYNYVELPVVEEEQTVKIKEAIKFDKDELGRDIFYKYTFDGNEVKVSPYRLNPRGNYDNHTWRDWARLTPNEQKEYLQWLIENNKERIANLLQLRRQQFDNQIDALQLELDNAEKALSKYDGHVEESLTEGKQDIENFKKWIENTEGSPAKYMSEGNKEAYVNNFVNAFNEERKNLKPPFNDYYYWIKQNDWSAFTKMIADQGEKKASKQRERDGAKLIYSDNDWKVYEITTYEASVKYGANTKWCISGSKRWANGNSGMKFWDDYTKSGVKFYFFINKDTKYALALYPNGTDFEIFDAQDNAISYIPNAPIIDSIPVDYYTQNEDRLLLNLVKTGQLPHVCSILSSYLWNNFYDVDIYDKSGFDDFLNQIRENVNDEYVKWLAVYNGLKDEEWYKEETGEEYDEEWGGDTTYYLHNDLGFLDNYASLEDALTKDNPYFDYANCEYFISDLYDYDIDCCKDWVAVWLHIRNYIDEDALINFIKGDIRDYWNYEDFEKVGLSKAYLQDIDNYDDEDDLEEHLGSNVKLDESVQEVDSEGNPLTQEQVEFFKDSKVRDSQGRLLVCYHGTGNDFDEFKQELIGSGTHSLPNVGLFGKGFYFSNHDYIASKYGKTKAYYLNINNPFVYADYRDGESAQKIVKDTGLNFRLPYSSYYEDTYLSFLDTVEDQTNFTKYLIEKGYDGIIASDPHTPRDLEIVAFYPNQIKAITNKTPSNSDNINEVLEDNLDEDVNRSFPEWQFGAKSFAKAFPQEDIEYMDNHQTVSSHPLYRCNTIEGSYKIGDTITFDRYRSFSKGAQGFNATLENVGVYFSPEECWCMQTRGKVSYFDATKVVNSILYQHQKEVLVKGTFKVVDITTFHSKDTEEDWTMYVVEQIDNGLDESLTEDKDTVEFLYHGSPSPTLNLERDSTLWLAEDYDYALGFGDYIHICSAYIPNILEVGNTDGYIRGLIPTQFSKEFTDLANKLNMQPKELLKACGEDCKNIYSLVRTKQFRKICMEKGYDAVETEEFGNICYGVFNRHNVELIDTEGTDEEPTPMNEAFSYTDRTNVNNLTELDKQYFDYIYTGQSKKAKEILNKLALNWGALSDGNTPLELYHGTPSRFTKFDAKQGFNVDAIYFSNSQSVAAHWSARDEYGRGVGIRGFAIDEINDLVDGANRDPNKLLDILNNHLYYQIGVNVVDHDDKYGDMYRLETPVTSSPLGYKKTEEIYFLPELPQYGVKYKEHNLVDELLHTIEYVSNKAFYQNNTLACYLKMSKPLVVDAKGSTYYEVEFEGKKTNTETISSIAKKRGYDGVIVKTVYETDLINIKCDDYIVFEPNQIKSCNLIVTDDEGDIIPPSKRFTTSDDIREGVQEHLGSNVEDTKPKIKENLLK